MFIQSIQQKISNICYYEDKIGRADVLLNTISWPTFHTILDAVAVQCYLKDHEQEARGLYDRIKKQQV